MAGRPPNILVIYTISLPKCCCTSTLSRVEQKMNTVVKQKNIANFIAIADILSSNIQYRIDIKSMVLGSDRRSEFNRHQN